MSRHVVMSCYVVTLETDPCVCPCQFSPTHVKDQNPCLCKVSFSTFPPPTSVTYMSVSSKSGSKTPKSDQAKCHAPFSSREHVGSIMSNMSFHDVMSRHVVMSCHVVTLETDPCVCHCQYSPTHVKDQNPSSVQSVIFNLPTTHLSYTYMSVSSKSGSKTPKSDQAKCHAPFSSREHVGSIMSNMSFHDVMSCHFMTSCHVIS